MVGRKAVVTGMGVITPLGNTVDAFWNNLIQGKSGVGPITKFDSSDFSAKIAAEVKDFNPEDYMARKAANAMPLVSQYAVAAAKMAIEDSGIELNEHENPEIATIVGVGMGSLKDTEEQRDVLMNKGPSRVSPRTVPRMMPNAPPAPIAISYKLNDVCYAVASACASGGDAIAAAADRILLNKAEVVITGGVDALVTELTTASFGEKLHALSRRNDEPEKASRPFDKNRDGFDIGEGAGILVLESLEHALRRGARIYAELPGYGQTNDAYHITKPVLAGVQPARAMEKAIAMANIQPGYVDYINAHGTSTKYNDFMETNAIKLALKERALCVPISSTKSMHGHMIGGAGGVEAIISILALRNNMIPPTINYETPDPDCDLDYVPNEAREKELQVAMSNSFGFGGHNVSLLFKRYDS